jgi:hypothetical protein
MSNEELIKRKYVKLFSLVIETEGQKLNNKKFKGIENCLNNNKQTLDWIIKDDSKDLVELINFLITSLVVYIHPREDLVGQENVERTNYLIDDLFLRHLDLPTRTFTSNYKLKDIQKPSSYGKTILTKGEKI